MIFILIHHHVDELKENEVHKPRIHLGAIVLCCDLYRFDIGFHQL
jgi:hypothetical protein